MKELIGWGKLWEQGRANEADAVQVWREKWAQWLRGLKTQSKQTTKNPEKTTKHNGDYSDILNRNCHNRTTCLNHVENPTSQLAEGKSTPDYSQLCSSLMEHMYMNLNVRTKVKYNEQ